MDFRKADGGPGFEEATAGSMAARLQGGRIRVYIHQKSCESLLLLLFPGMRCMPPATHVPNTWSRCVSIQRRLFSSFLFLSFMERRLESLSTPLLDGLSLCVFPQHVCLFIFTHFPASAAVCFSTSVSSCFEVFCCFRATSFSSLFPVICVSFCRLSLGFLLFLPTVRSITRAALLWSFSGSFSRLLPFSAVYSKRRTRLEEGEGERDRDVAGRAG